MMHRETFVLFLRGSSRRSATSYGVEDKYLLAWRTGPAILFETAAFFHITNGFGDAADF
jgi:hypothetical protein